MKAGHSHIGDIYKIDGAYYKAVDNNHHLVKIDPSDVDQMISRILRTE